MSAGHDNFTLNRCLCRGGCLFCVGPAFLRDCEAVGIIFGVAVDAVPFLLTEVDGADREENILLLVDHFFGPLQNCSGAFVPGLIVLRFLCKSAQFVADLIVNGPHDI